MALDKDNRTPEELHNEAMDATVSLVALQAQATLEGDPEIAKYVAEIIRELVTNDPEKLGAIVLAATTMLTMAAISDGAFEGVEDEPDEHDPDFGIPGF